MLTILTYRLSFFWFFFFFFVFNSYWNCIFLLFHSSFASYFSFSVCAAVNVLMNIVIQRIVTTSLRGFTSLSIKTPKNYINPIKNSTNFVSNQKSVILNQFNRKMSNETASEKPRIVFVLGAPGSGKVKYNKIKCKSFVN